MVDPMSNPVNQGVIARLRARHPDALAIAAPADHRDPYWEAGSRPDVVERVWDELGARLPTEARALVFGTVSLVHPTSGAILVLAAGTMYVLRLTPGDLEEAARIPSRFWMPRRFRRSRGLERRQVRILTDGSVYDVSVKYGTDWILGGWDEREAEWLAHSFRAFAG